jgi:hypothetical protein
MAGVIIGELKKLRFGSAPPSLEIRFSGDLADTDNIFIDATLSGEKIHRGLYRLAGVHAGFHVRAGVFNLKQLTANDGRGTLDTTGSFDSKTGAGEFHIQSSLDAQALLHEFGWTKPLDEMVFYSTPVLDVSGKIERGENLNISFIGGFSLKKFAIRSVIFDGCRANFSWDGTRWFMNDLQVVNRTGELHASAISTTEGFRMKLQSSINPKTFLPLFSGPGAEFLSLWEFDQPPQIQFAMHGPTAEFETCEGEGSIKLGRTRLRGVAMNSATSKIRIKNQAFSCENFKIERQEGSGTGTFVLDLGRKEVRFDHIKARLNPSEAILWVNPDYLEHVVPYRFKKVPNVAVNGVAQFGGGKNTNLEILVDAPDGLDYVFLKRTLSFPKASARLLFTDDHLRISNLAGSVFAGRLRGDVDFSFSRKAPPAYTADIEVENVDFEQLTNLYFNYKDSKGELNGEYKFSGHGGDARRMEGKGTATVTNGNVFAIPILGPLSGLINDVMPGVGYNTARRASVNFDIADGVIHAHDFLVHGGGFSMLGGGDLFFLDDKMNFHVRMNAQGVPGVVLFPVSKLFEYISDGAMSKPLWRPKALSRAVPVEKRQ